MRIPSLMVAVLTASAEAIDSEVRDSLLQSACRSLYTWSLDESVRRMMGQVADDGSGW